MPVLTPVTALYRDRLEAAEARAAATLDDLLAGLGDAGDAEALLADAGAAAGPLVAAAQLSFIGEALAYLMALTAEAARVPLAGVAPYAMPAGVAGFSAAGIPVGDLTAMAPRVYLSRLLRGEEPGQAAEAARSFLESVTRNEPYRAANAAVVDNAVGDERLTGRVMRVTEPDACAWCVMIAERGYVIHEVAGRPITFAAHAHCRCTASPEVSKHVTSRRSVRYARAMRAGEARVPPPRPAGGGLA